jgi:hypothetical protein
LVYEEYINIDKFFILNAGASQRPPTIGKGKGTDRRDAYQEDGVIVHMWVAG